MLNNIKPVKHESTTWRYSAYPQLDRFAAKTLGSRHQGNRRTLEHLQVLSIMSAEDHADEIFRRRPNTEHTTRFSSGEHNVLYTALDIETAYQEYLHHYKKIAIHALNRTGPRSTVLARYCFHFSGLVADLRTVSWKELKEEHPYEFCRNIGKQAVRRRLAGLLSPSKRHSGGTCLPVFQREAVRAGPQPVEAVTVHYDPKNDSFTLVPTPSPERN